MRAGDTVRIVYGGTVTSGGVILRTGRRISWDGSIVQRFKVRHHHGRVEWLDGRFLRPGL